MKMVHNLIIILLIIGFSFLFETSCNYEFNSQLTFILLSLFIVVIYKFLINKCIMKENFSSFDDQISNFLKSGLPDRTDPLQYKKYSKQLTQLQDKVDIMNEYLNDIKETAEGKNKGDSVGDQLNIQASQQIQDYRIREMQKEIERTTDLIKEAKMREDASKFKKIPIYSSCVVSNADGSLQVDTPLPNANQPNSNSNNNVSNVGNFSSGSSSSLLTPLRNVNNIGDVKLSGSASENQKVNGNANQLGAMVKTVLEKGVTVNLQTQ
jgi:hypothetical protein